MRKINCADELSSMVRRQKAAEKEEDKRNAADVLEENIKFRKRTKAVIDAFKALAARWPEIFSILDLAVEDLNDFTVPKLQASSYQYYAAYAEGYGINPCNPRYTLQKRYNFEGRQLQITESNTAQALVPELLRVLAHDVKHMLG